MASRTRKRDESVDYKEVQESDDGGSDGGQGGDPDYKEEFDGGQGGDSD